MIIWNNLFTGNVNEMYFLIEMFLTESFVAEYICSCRLCNLGEMYNKIKYIKFFSFKKLNAKCLVSPYVGKSSQNPKFLGFQLGVVGVFNLSGKHLNLSIMGWPSLLFPRLNGSDCYYKEHRHSTTCDFHPFLHPLPSGPSLQKRLPHTSSKTLEGRCPSPYNLLFWEKFSELEAQ